MRTDSTSRGGIGRGRIPLLARLKVGSGLVGLTDRVEASGGTISISSRAGAGTRLTAELPLDPG